jgi:hypothetical protein
MANAKRRYKLDPGVTYAAGTGDREVRIVGPDSGEYETGSADEQHVLEVTFGIKGHDVDEPATSTRKGKE